jgi:deoxyribonuclease V
MVYEGKYIGYGLRSSVKAKRLLYVSPGHKVSKITALNIVRNCCRSRIPEPIREAHKAAGEFKKEGMAR